MENLSCDVFFSCGELAFLVLTLLIRMEHSFKRATRYRKCANCSKSERFLPAGVITDMFGVVVARTLKMAVCGVTTSTFSCISRLRLVSRMRRVCDTIRAGLAGLEAVRYNTRERMGNYSPRWMHSARFSEGTMIPAKGKPFDCRLMPISKKIFAKSIATL